MGMMCFKLETSFILEKVILKLFDLLNTKDRFEDLRLKVKKVFFLFFCTNVLASDFNFDA